MLILQAVLVSVICMAFFTMPSVNGSYWLLTDLSTQLYIMMYLFMFFAAIVLKYKFPVHRAGFKIPGGIVGAWIVCLMGIAGCLLTFMIGFIPPANIDVGGFLHYELMFAGGLFVMIFPVMGLYAFEAIQRTKGKQEYD